MAMPSTATPASIPKVNSRHRLRLTRMTTHVMGAARNVTLQSSAPAKKNGTTKCSRGRRRNTTNPPSENANARKSTRRSGAHSCTNAAPDTCPYPGAYSETNASAYSGPNSRTNTKPPSEVTRDPWKSTFNELLNDS